MSEVLTYSKFCYIIQRLKQQASHILYRLDKFDINNVTLVYLHEIPAQTEDYVRCCTVSQNTTLLVTTDNFPQPALIVKSKISYFVSI